MGQPKALLAVGTDSFVGRVCRSAVSAGVRDLVIVTAPGLPPLDSSLASAGVAARIVENPTPADGQLSSLRVGLSIADRPGVDAVLVNLVDVPLVAPDTMRAVVETFRRTRAPIVRPVARDGRHGHPVLFARAVFDDLRRADLSAGAKAVLRAHASFIVDVPVDDEGAFADIDTPDDYARLICSASGT
jgi:molybdenum cofactor cytidylyltransferase